ncbi:hypothetical protein [Streptacidiphilus sp. PAMC 29251]
MAGPSGGVYHPLDVGGTPIADWAKNEQNDYTGGHGVDASRTDTGQSLFLKDSRPRHQRTDHLPDTHAHPNADLDLDVNADVNATEQHSAHLPGEVLRGGEGHPGHRHHGDQLRALLRR